MGNSVMADNLIQLTFDSATLERFKLRFQKKSKEKVAKALNAVKREWQQEFRRQDVSMQSQWLPLKTWVTHRSDKKRSSRIPAKIDSDSYYARKLKAYQSGKRNKDQFVKYLRILKRSGLMLDHYINGIRVNNTALTVTIPYPKSPYVNIRAKVHQGEYRLPFGVRAHRPYNLDRFRFVADREIRRELK